MDVPSDFGHFDFPPKICDDYSRTASGRDMGFSSEGSV